MKLENAIKNDIKHEYELSVIESCIKELKVIFEEKGLIEFFNKLSNKLQNEVFGKLYSMNVYELKYENYKEAIYKEIITKLLDIRNQYLNVKFDEIKEIIGEYILLQNGKLYKYKELKDTNVDRIYAVRENYYKIKTDNTILPIENTIKNELDFYLNNNNCKYKKIIIYDDKIVALTNNGDIRAFSLSVFAGVIPENYKNVDDILFKQEYAGNRIIPYIVKNNKQMPLYVEY